ncbi:MAG: GGDEF domain-containing protein [Gammaproteobacteria bacterium]|nr:GGDEF domain-containing protein [Gammaproteobacteria bacterium]
MDITQRNQLIYRFGLTIVVLAGILTPVANYLIGNPSSWSAILVIWLFVLPITIGIRLQPANPYLAYLLVIVLNLLILSIIYRYPADYLYIIYAVIIPVLNFVLLPLRWALPTSLLLLITLIPAVIGMVDNYQYLPVRVLPTFVFLTILMLLWAVQSDAKDRQIKRLAFTDLLTGLPNAVALQAHLNQRRPATDPLFWLVKINILKFENLQLIFGEQTTHNLLHCLTLQLQTLLTESPILARSDNNAFVTTVSFAHYPKIERLTDAITATLQACVVKHLYGYQLKTAIGIAHSGICGTDANELLEQANIAIETVRKSGGGCVHYEPQMKTEKEYTVKLREALSQAIAKDQLQVVFQPRVNPGNHQVCGMEALCRWHSPELGNISPEIFIALAEKNNWIITLGEQVLTKSLQFMQQLQQQGERNLVISVNVSPQQLYQEHFAQWLADKLHNFKISPHHIELEITEGILLRQETGALEVLHQLHQLGVKIVLDDFGTGYSSLSYLKLFQFDMLKIDRSYVHLAEQSHYDRQLMFSIVTMAHRLNMGVVAEGVETERQLALIQTMGCEEVQGWYYSKALPADEFKIFLKQQKELATRSA